MFEELGGTIREEVVLTLFHAQIEVNEPQLEPEADNGNLQYQHETAAGSEVIAAAGGGATSVGGGTSVGTAYAPGPSGTATATAVNKHKDVGRNDPCWCGSGKKFKKCHGA